MATGMIEPAAVVDTFACGLGGVENIGGGCLRFYLYVNQSLTDGTMERIIVAKIVIPSSALRDAITQTTEAMDTFELMPFRGAPMH